MVAVPEFSQTPASPEPSPPPPSALWSVCPQPSAQAVRGQDFRPGLQFSLKRKLINCVEWERMRAGERASTMLKVNKEVGGGSGLLRDLPSLSGESHLGGDGSWEAAGEAS